VNISQPKLRSEKLDDDDDDDDDDNNNNNKPGQDDIKEYSEQSYWALHAYFEKY